MVINALDKGASRGERFIYRGVVAMRPVNEPVLNTTVIDKRANYLP